jgi:hypothetical protein
MPKVWEIIRRFKEFCQNRGWKTSASEDWVELNDRIHNFLLARNISLSSFKKIAMNGKCVIREGLSYKVTKASYVAWLFSETPARTLIDTVLEDSDLSNRIALYDLSPLLNGKDCYVKLNRTDSLVFKGFEEFLESDLKINVSPFSSLSNSENDVKGVTIAELA